MQSPSSQRFGKTNLMMFAWVFYAILASGNSVPPGDAMEGRPEIVTNALLERHLRRALAPERTVARARRGCDIAVIGDLYFSNVSSTLRIRPTRPRRGMPTISTSAQELRNGPFAALRIWVTLTQDSQILGSWVGRWMGEREGTLNWVRSREVRSSRSICLIKERVVPNIWLWALHILVWVNATQKRKCNSPPYISMSQIAGDANLNESFAANFNCVDHDSLACPRTYNIPAWRRQSRGRGVWFFFVRSGRSFDISLSPIGESRRIGKTELERRTDCSPRTRFWLLPVEQKRWAVICLSQTHWRTRNAIARVVHETELQKLSHVAAAV